ncbi:MAG: hypothetical protein ACR2N2_08660 [Acidimicrobiia bacterium]
MVKPAGTKAPGIVIFVAVLLFIKATVAAVASITAFLARGTEEAAQLGLTDDNLMATGIGQAIVALFVIGVAMYLLSGAAGARLIVAIVVGISIAANVWFMLTHHTGGYLSQGLISVALGLFVLWGLYGSESGSTYFDEQELA